MPMRLSICFTNIMYLQIKLPIKLYSKKYQQLKIKLRLYGTVICI